MDSVVQHLQDFIHKQVYDNFRKRGIVVGISGGIDSAISAKLCCNAVGKENVLGIILPEKESNPQSQDAITLVYLDLKYPLEYQYLSSSPLLFRN